ncbi:hypothetical protein BKA70DRAFT_1420102 [Coprinopsis sp. MPI-PUGE-AT-0042]|nr:hypothetical protein BKA70DRAFT_1420102 [Coprinopsis sp. MPI-PUGE-AT-0042]
MTEDEGTISTGEDSLATFFDNILKPGSSLNPTFLAILDGAFAFLFFILGFLAFFTWNIHVFFLIGIELALWASVKWFVNELKQLPPPQPEGNETEQEDKKEQ